MNQTQVRYAIKRVTEIENTKVSEASKKFVTEGKTLSNDEKLEALKKGRFTTTKAGKYNNWFYCVKFTDEVSRKIDRKAQSEAVNKIRTEANRIRDELMLGDHEEALKLIKKFEKLLDKHD